MVSIACFGRLHIAFIGFTVRFASGSGDIAGHLAEGLSTALQVFDDLGQLREPK